MKRLESFGKWAQSAMNATNYGCDLLIYGNGLYIPLYNWLTSSS